MEKYNEYKDSGVQWLGQIPSHWRLDTLRKYLKFVSIKNHPEKQLLSVTREQGVIVRDTESKEENHNFIPDDLSGYKYVQPGDFCINKMKSWQGSYGVSNYEGIVSPAYYICKLSGVYKPFFSTAIRSKAYIPFFAQYSKGIRVDQWDLSPIALKEIPFFLPPLSEQQAIVSFLDDKCAKIDQLLENKQKELNLCREGIESLIFSVSDETSTVIPSWETCFPKNWNTKLGRALFEEVKVKGTNNERFLAVTQENGLIYKDGGDVNFVTAENKESQKVVCPGQFVISLRSFEGGIEYSDKKGLISQAYVVLKLRELFDTEELRMYYRFLFKSKPFVQRLNTISDSMRDGKSIKFKDIRGFSFPVPDSERLQRILALIHVYDKLKSSFDKEKKLLTEYKQRLIADVVTGQIKVC